MLIIQTKRCIKCKKLLPATTEYFHQNNRLRLGLYNICKECRKKLYTRPEIRKRNKKSNKRWKEKNREHIQKYRREYRMKPENKEKHNKQSQERNHKIRKENRLFYNFYINLHHWLRKYKPQLNYCEICLKIKKFKELDCANITGIYNKNFNNYKWMCKSCHQIYDKKYGLKNIFGVD